MPEAAPPPPFYLIIIDHDRGVFAVEGPMTDDRAWQAAAREARNHQRHIDGVQPNPLSPGTTNLFRPRFNEIRDTPTFQHLATSSI